MRLDFDDDGPGPVVVLLHGFPLDRTMWAHQRSSVGSIYRMIAPDLRGHGTSAAPEGTYAIDEMADDVIETLDALQLEGPLVFGGLSMGGYLALSIAARFPERVRGLILMCTKATPDSPEAARAREELASKVEEAGNAEPVVSEMLPKLFSRNTFERHPEVVTRIRQRMLRMPVRALTGTIRGLATRPDRTADLTQIAAPTLILAGLEDQLIPFTQTDSLARALSRAHLITVPDAGHLAPLENPEVSNQAILDFLENLS